MVTSAVAIAKPTPIPAAVVRQQSLSTAAYVSPLTPATIVAHKELPHASLLPLHLSASALASAPHQLTAASSMQPSHYAYSHSSSAPSLPALLLSANSGAASLLSPTHPSSLHPSAFLSFAASANGSMSCHPLSSAFDLSSSICRSKQRLARKAELARQSRKRKKSAVATMADTIRQLKDDNARLRQRLAALGVTDTQHSGGGSGSRRGKRKALYKAEPAKLKHDDECDTSSEADDDDDCPSELTHSSSEYECDAVLPGAAELAALSPSSTPSSIASSLLSAASSMDLPLTSIMGKRGRT